MSSAHWARFHREAQSISYIYSFVIFLTLYQKRKLFTHLPYFFKRLFLILSFFSVFMPHHYDFHKQTDEIQFTSCWPVFLEILRLFEYRLCAEKCAGSMRLLLLKSPAARRPCADGSIHTHTHTLVSFYLPTWDCKAILFLTIRVEVKGRVMCHCRSKASACMSLHLQAVGQSGLYHVVARW